MLEQMASELAPKYSGKVVVRKYYPDPEIAFFSGGSAYYIFEEVSSKVFGIFPSKKQRDIFAVRVGFFGEAHGKREMSTLLADLNAEETVMKHVNKYAEENGVTNVRMQRGL